MKKTVLLVVGSIVLLTCKASAISVLSFWDVNGVTPGCGSATPTGTWGVDAYWNEDFSGGTGPYGTNVATKSWDDGNFAVFAAGGDATGAYTVFVKGTIKVADIHVDLGEVTFDPDPVSGGAFQMLMWENAELTNNVNRLLSAGHSSDATIGRYNVALNGAHNLIRYKRGTIILAATNVYTGTTTIEGGVLQLGNPHVLPSNSSLVLANNDTTRNDFNTLWQYTPAVFATAGFSQNLGPLTLTGTDGSVQRVIDFGDGTSALAFADSSAEDWSGFTLTLSNYTAGVDSLRFGTTASGSTGTQLALMQFAQFANLPGQIDPQGYVTPALPVLLPPVRTDASTVELSWTAVVGRTYRVQAKTNLSTAGWDDLTDVYASTSPASHTDTSATSSQRYYRVRVVP